jgi:hypothetical protein
MQFQTPRRLIPIAVIVLGVSVGGLRKGALHAGIVERSIQCPNVETVGYAD